MKTLKILFILITIILLTNIKAQVDDTKDKNKAQIKVKINDLPKAMENGSSTDIVVTITNKSKTDAWEYSGNFTYSVDGSFTLTRDNLTSSKFTLNPRESKDVLYKLTAPSEEGKHKVTITFYDGGRKVGTKTKVIKVGTSTSDNEKNKNKDKNKDKNKSENKNK